MSKEFNEDDWLHEVFRHSMFDAEDFLKGLFILDEKGEPHQAKDFKEWTEGWQVDKCRVGLDRIGDSEISTVFLSIHLCREGKAPLLWETMVFGGPLDKARDRCSGSREQAEAMHARMVEKVKQQQQPQKLE